LLVKQPRESGIHAKLGTETSEAVCRETEAAFRSGQFEASMLSWILAVGETSGTPLSGAQRQTR